MTKLAVFSRQNLMIAVNLFSSMCTIMLTMPQFLYVMYDITVDRALGRFQPPLLKMLGDTVFEQ